MNNKFIYVFTVADKEELLAKGFKCIGDVKIAGKPAFLFENKTDRLAFNELDKKKFLFSNKVFI